MRSLTQSVGVSVSPADLICRHQLGQTKKSCQVCFECQVSHVMVMMMVVIMMMMIMTMSPNYSTLH